MEKSCCNGGGKCCCPVHCGAYWLVWVGALNWGLIGAFNFNLVNTLFGSWPSVERVVYILVGLAALAMLLKGKCKKCQEGCEVKAPAKS